MRRNIPDRQGQEEAIEVSLRDKFETNLESTLERCKEGHRDHFEGIDLPKILEKDEERLRNEFEAELPELIGEAIDESEDEEDDEDETESEKDTEKA
jgi:hypothetical protein